MSGQAATEQFWAAVDTPTTSPTMKFYRYQARHYASVNEFDEISSRYSRVECDEFDLLKETPKGYWIGSTWSKRWVSKTAKKRYAYPTKKEALTSYIARTTKRIDILKSDLKDTEFCLEEAKRMEAKAEAA